MENDQTKNNHQHNSDSTSTSTPGWLTILLNKLSVQNILTIVLAVLVVVGTIAIVTILRGGSIKIGNINIGGIKTESVHDKDSTTTSVDPDLMKVSDFSRILDEYYSEHMTKNQLFEITEELVKKAQVIDSYENLFSFQLFKLELAIQNAGGYIDIQKTDTESINSFKLIQIVLKEINHYDGNIDGDMQRTFNALKAFQLYYNEIITNPNARFIEEDLGIFGNKSLEAIRGFYIQKRKRA